jgi:signal transduction histidine kinase
MEKREAVPETPGPDDPELAGARLRTAALNLQESALQMPLGSVIAVLTFSMAPGFQGGSPSALAAWCLCHWGCAVFSYQAASGALGGLRPPLGGSWTVWLSASMGLTGAVWGALTWVAFAPGSAGNQTALALFAFTAIGLHSLRFAALPPVLLSACCSIAAVALARHAAAFEPWSFLFLSVLPVWIACFLAAALKHGASVTEMIATKIANARLAGENAAARDAARHASSAKSAFLANMSHELRTPLNAVIGFAGLIRAAPDDAWEKPRHREYAADIEESASHLLDMINSLLDIAKIEAGRMTIEPERLDGRHEIAGALRLIDPLVQRNRQTLQAAVSAPVILADPRALRTILVNLLSNAVKYAGNGAEIGVELRGGLEWVELTVRDNGPGIPAEAAARLFERFERIDNSYTAATGGTGLGLSLVRELARLHGGDASIQSAPGRGMRVSVRFPRSSPLKRAA